MASKIEIRQHQTGTLLGYFYTHLEPDDVRQRLTARGLRAFAEGVGLYIPEINDPQETPFYDRPDVLVGEITALDPAAYQTILARSSGGGLVGGPLHRPSVREESFCDVARHQMGVGDDGPNPATTDSVG
jgi:hypothetical protein